MVLGAEQATYSVFLEPFRWPAAKNNESCETEPQQESCGPGNQNNELKDTIKLSRFEGNHSVGSL